jgi:hypothetical protein
MKPKPLVVLKNFTVPSIIGDLFLRREVPEGSVPAGDVHERSGDIQWPGKCRAVR